MSKLSWQQIRTNAIQFQKEWKDETSESAEAKSFWDQFFEVFGISRRRVAIFEKRVKKIDGIGFIDLLWKGVILVEHKSRGKNLESAYKQATDYFPGLTDGELPKYILVSDFENFVLYDLESGGQRSFPLSRLFEHIELFGFMAGYQQQVIKEQDPVNIDAAYNMGLLHDKLKKIGYTGLDLEIYLVRLLFCMFADDTGIFEKNLFKDYVESETRIDGSDLAGHIEQIFETLNTPEDSRLTNINELMKLFPYVNGNLFEKRLRVASFDSEMRKILLDCSELNWGKISPAIFGSLFQSVMNPEERRYLGAHYTSEENILKVIKPLFLDDLYSEFEQIKNRVRQRQEYLEHFHQKISELTFFDPACGCGNFLIVAYRELRLLELEVIRELLGNKMLISIDMYAKVNVDQFYGIEIEEFPSQIAQVAMWLIDHQMNMKLSNEFGDYFIRLPLRKSAKIIHGNALHIDWSDIIDPLDCSYILGNPPFIGARLMSTAQNEDLRLLTQPNKDTEKTKIGEIKGGNNFDFVAGWFIKAADFIHNSQTEVGLVSTNSIVQGEQANTLWKYLFKEKSISINFAHQTFKWTNEARGNAAVYCVIVGFSMENKAEKKLYSYPDIRNEATMTITKNINQYLLDGPVIFIEATRKPITDRPPAEFGVALLDNGNYSFTKKEMEEFINKEPLAQKYMRPFIGSYELINNKERYCLYLKDCPPNDLRNMPLVRKLVSNVQDFRLSRKRAATKRLGETPTLLAGNSEFTGTQLIIPRVSSENRKYIPIGYFDNQTICSESAFRIRNASLYLFGILNSTMHMAWTRTVCGRLKSDYRYSNTLVYNNFVFPTPSEKAKKNIEKLSQQILEMRKSYLDRGNSLADLYDAVAMPVDLMRAHQALDLAVDKAYRSKRFSTDNERVAHLFRLYEAHVN